MWHVYILQCADGSLYTGSTTDLDRRLREHNAGRGGGYTRSRRPVEILYSERRRTRSTAQRREAEIKGWPRSEKLAFARPVPDARMRR